MTNPIIEYCQSCGRVLVAGTEVWLTLDRRTNTYTDQKVPARYDQGEFAFGKNCALLARIDGDT